jgi:tetratricopeptide (TPR) repeat protein
VALAPGPGEASEVERAHLASCAQCRRELDWASELPEADQVDEEDDLGESGSGAEPSRPRSLPTRWAWAGFAAAAVVLTLILVPRGPGPDLAALARVEPLPVRITRAVPEPGSFEEARLMGLDSYAAGDYADARGHLARSLELEPNNGEMLLYLGSAELLLGELESAMEHFRAARDRSPDGVVRDEAAWQSANAALLGGRREEAVNLLEQLGNYDGSRGDDARALLEQLD